MQINTDNLKLGDLIPQDMCENIIGDIAENMGESAFALAMLNLMGLVSKQLKKQHGRDITVRIVKNELHILTDSESAEYNPKRFDVGLRMARRAHRRLLAVNVSKLDAAERGMYAKNVSNQSFKIALLRKRETIEATPTERTTPVMTFVERKK